MNALPLVLAILLQSKLRPEEVPAFELRAREPQGRKLSFRFGAGGGPAAAEGGEWSPWLKFGPPQIEAVLKGYPAMYMKGFPLVVHVKVEGVADPTVVEAELRFDEGGDPVKLSAELFGPTLGVLVWRDEAKAPRAATMAEYNRRYWKALEGVEVPAAERPKKFAIVDRFIGGDDDRRDWSEGVGQLARAGFSAIMAPPSPKIRAMLLDAGHRRTAWAVYNPPGYAFDYEGKDATPEGVAAWAAAQAKPYLDAGYARGDMALFAMSDEPGWYYPKMLATLKGNAAGLARFREYVKGQGLAPADVGAASWEDVGPIGRSAAQDLASKRLFYWTMRFFAWDSARHFAACTSALEKAFAPGTPIFTNWNFFAGRFYVPGPVANNADKQSPDAGMGGHDWLEFGRMRGGTMLWTEDWFGDGRAYQWSFYAAKLRSAAAKGGVEFGGYVIPRTAGDREDGILQKILCVVGSGGKAIKYFVFGPEYNFPGNCYSERARLLPRMAEAHRMIGKAEDLLWPGRRPRPEAAILAPRSAQPWDPRGISDATNSNLNGATMDYMAEVFDLYLALQHANIPADFVEEDDLAPAGLAAYRVVYVTEPNVPVEGQRGLAEWVRGGGTLVTVAGAASRDRYDEPCGALAEALGIPQEPRERLLIANVRNDAPPAAVEREAGRGRAVHFGWLPGIAYWKSSKEAKDRLPVGFSESIRGSIVGPCRGLQAPVEVDRPLVETPLLLSKEGAAITLLNWTGEPIDSLRVTARVPFAVKSVESVKRGKLAFEPATGGAAFKLPLGAADIILVRP